MKAADAQDIDTAYDLFIEGIDRRDVEKLVMENVSYFQGYESISFKAMNIEYVGPDFAEYKGMAKYHNGDRNTIAAALVKVEEDWKLVSIWFP
jgi:hypothetical protein